MVVLNDPTKLYHTTSFASLKPILFKNKLIPKDKQSFVSLSEKSMIHGDISGSDVILVFDRKPFLKQVEKVVYNLSWFNQHIDQSSYIAGEGWREQFTVEDWVEPSEEEEEDGVELDTFEEAEKVAEKIAFLSKSVEKEWITKEQGKPLLFGNNYPQQIVLIKPNHSIKSKIEALVGRLVRERPIEVTLLGGK